VPSKCTIVESKAPKLQASGALPNVSREWRELEGGGRDEPVVFITLNAKDRTRR
jgi:hypothetical protein